jgi:YadA-like membrane anchor domain
MRNFGISTLALLASSALSLPVAAHAAGISITGAPIAALPAGESGGSIAPTQQISTSSTITLPTTPGIAGLPAGKSGGSIAPVQQVGTGTISVPTGAPIAALPVGESGGSIAPVQQSNTGGTTITVGSLGSNGGETGTEAATDNQLNDVQSQVTSNEAAQTAVNSAQQTENGTLQSGINTNSTNISNVSTNLGNFEGSQATTNAGFNNDINGIDRQITGIDGQLNSLNGEIGKVEREADAGVAAAMAIPSIPLLEPGKQWVGAAYGEYAGQSALGVGYAYQVNQHWNIGAGAAVPVSGNGSMAFKVQAGYEF